MQVREWDWWAGPASPHTWAVAASKYASLEHLSTMPEGQDRSAALRSASRAWPGALREAELAGPVHCRRRHVASTLGLRTPSRTRAGWREDDDAAAVLLWSSLHALLGDQLSFRARGSERSCEAFIVSLPARARPRWPDAPTLERVAGAKLRPRQAYLWLASQAGLRLAELNRLLFARTGHWDERDDDPEWSKIG